VRAHWPSRGSRLTALVEVQLGAPAPWRNVVGLTTSYTVALLVGALIAGLVLSIALISTARHRHR
jgi:hypothetical protein